MVDDQEQLFTDGLKAFNRREFYDAHEYWEALWSDHKLDDALFIQGLIQVSVGCFHITNSNINGAQGLFAKCLPKLERFTMNSRGVVVSDLIRFVNEALEQLETMDDTSQFKWDRLPQLMITTSRQDG